MTLEEIARSFVSQAPTVFVLLWIFSQLRTDVVAFTNRLLTLIENCLENADDDGANVKNAPN